MFVLGGADEFAEETVDFWEMAEDFGDADDGEVFGVNDDLAAGGAHAVSARTEEGKVHVGTGL